MSYTASKRYHCAGDATNYTNQESRSEAKRFTRDVGGDVGSKAHSGTSSPCASRPIAVILEGFGSAGPPPCDMVKGGGASSLGAWAWMHATLSYIRLPS